MNVLGIDIGYSNLKISAGVAGSNPKSILRPAGAAPAELFGTRVDGKAQDDFLHVLVDGKPFVAGVSSDRAEMWERSLHADYSKSDSYKALMHSGMLLSEMSEIDVLVTGLPVSQALSSERCKELEVQFMGQHQITPKRIVNVKKVKVIPQPVGGLLDFMNQQEVHGHENDLPIDDDTRVLVVDPGFFSLDWVMVTNGQLNRQSSGTTLNASSVLLEQASKLIGLDHGSSPTTENLENAVRQGKTSILLMGQRIDIAPYITKASELLADVTATSIQKSLRIEKTSPDIVVLVGGGAKFFYNAVSQVFPRLKTVIPKDSVFSNSVGYWLMGAHG